MMRRALLCIGICLFAIHFLLIPVWAVTVSITNIPSTLDISQVFGTDVSLSCSGCSDSYLRGVFYPSGTSYFGYTQDNSGNWSNAPASSCTTFFKIAQSDLQSGTWSGTLKVKLDTSSSYYNGPGEYSFKVGRYTSSCSSPTWSSESTIAVTGPTSTPTLAPATPTPTASPPTNTPTPIKTPTPTPSNTPTPTPSLKPTLTATPSVSISVVLGQATNSATITPEAPSPTVEVLGSYGDNTGKVLMGIGLLLLAGCGILVFRMYKRGDRLFI